MPISHSEFQPVTHRVAEQTLENLNAEQLKNVCARATSLHLLSLHFDRNGRTA